MFALAGYHLEGDFSEDDMGRNIARLVCGLALSIYGSDSEGANSALKHFDLQMSSVNPLHGGNIAVCKALLSVPAVRSAQSVVHQLLCQSCKSPKDSC